MSSSECTEDACVGCDAKTYELKGTQTTDSDSDDGCDTCMEIEQVENGGTVSMLPDKLIKIENLATVVEGNGPAVPYAAASVHIPTAKNGVFYFPTQAMLAPRQSYPAFVTHSPCSHLTTHRLSHKRRTIEALAEGALMNTEEATRFQETIEIAKTKITVFDNTMKMEVSHDVLRKDDPVNTEPLENTVSLQKNDEQFAKIVSCYSLQQVNNSATTENETMISHGFVTCSTATTATAPTVDTNHADIETRSETTPPSNSTTVSEIDAGKRDIRAVNVASIPSSNQNPSSLDLAKISFNKTLKNETAHKTLSSTLAIRSIPKASVSSNIYAIPCTSSVRPEASKKLSSSKSVSQTSEESPARPVYIPKEIKPGSVELGLDECVNVKDICDKELTKWTAEDVAKFVRATDCSEYADTFIEQEIDGKALMLLNQDLLIQWMKLKLGPAMKLNSHILNLKHALHNRPQLS